MSARERKPTGGKSNFSARSWGIDERRPESSRIKSAPATQEHPNKIDRLIQQEVDRNKHSLAASGLFEQDIISAREAMKRSAGNLRTWVQQERDAQTVPVPTRVGSILSGGVNGFGNLLKETKVNPERYDGPAGAPALFDKDYQLMTPGRPWWERERFKAPHLAKSARDEVRPISPLPFGSALNVAAIQDDGKLTETEVFIGRRPDLAKRGERTVRRELLGEMLDHHEAQEMPAEQILGPEFYGLDRTKCLDKLMATLELDYKGQFPALHKNILDKEYLANVAKSNQIRRVIRPREVYAPPPHHPDNQVGYETSRRKHEETMNRLYGPSSGRAHAMPDRPDTWNRRDGLKAGIPGIQSFTFFAHQLQNAGFGAP